MLSLPGTQLDADQIGYHTDSSRSKSWSLPCGPWKHFQKKLGCLRSKFSCKQKAWASLPIPHARNHWLYCLQNQTHMHISLKRLYLKTFKKRTDSFSVVLCACRATHGGALFAAKHLLMVVNEGICCEMEQTTIRWRWSFLCALKTLTVGQREWQPSQSKFLAR